MKDDRFNKLRATAFGLVVVLMLVEGNSPSIAQTQASQVPAETCVLELSLPAGTSYQINERRYAETANRSARVLRFGPFKPGQIGEYRLTVSFPNGENAQRKLLLWGGQRVQVKLRPPGSRKLEIVPQTGHGSMPQAAAFSRNGQRLLTSSSNKAKVWNSGSLLETQTINLVNLGNTNTESVSFGRATLSPDGRRVLFPSTQNTAVLLDVDSGRDILEFRGHSAPIDSVAFNASGDWALTGANDNTVKLWDVQTGRTLKTFRGHRGSVVAVRFSADGRRVASGSLDRTARLWDVVSGKQLHQFGGHTRTVKAVEFNADGSRLLTCSRDESAKLWDTESGQEIQTFDGHENFFVSATFSPDGKLVATWSIKDALAKLWDAKTGREVRILEGHTAPVGAAAFSPDGGQLVTGGRDRTMRLWDVATGKTIRVFEGHTNWVTTIAFQPGADRVVSGSQDQSVRLWDLMTGRNLRTLYGHSGDLFSTAWSRNLGRAVSVDVYGSKAELWNSTTGELIHQFEGHRDYVPCIAYSSESRRLITGSRDNTAKVWDTETGQPVCTLQGHENTIVTVAVSADGRFALTGSFDSTAKLWDAQSGREIRTYSGHSGPVFAVAFTSDRQNIVSASGDGSARLWDLRSGRTLRTFRGHSEALLAVTTSEDGKLLLTASSDRTAKLWQISTGRLLHTLTGHLGDVNSVRFGLADRLILTSSDDETAKLWDARTGKELRTFAGHSGRVRSAAFSPDGSYVVTSSLDDTVRLWSVASGDELARNVGVSGADDRLILSPDGLFDGSPIARERVAFRVGDGPNILPVDRFFNDYYTPGLWDRSLLGERPQPEVEIGPTLPPKVRIVSPETDQDWNVPVVRVEVQAEDQGGGIRGPWLKHNGARLLSAVETCREGNTLQRTFEVRLVEGSNRLEVGASTSDEFASVASETAALVLRYEKPLDKPRLHMLAVGCNDYADTSLRLRYARQDAEAMATLFQERGQTLYEDVRVKLLLDEDATPTQVRKAFRAISGEARPQDTLLVFLAGHGTTVGQRYFYVPHSFRRETETLETDIKRQAIAADVLGDWMAEVACLKRMLILDTCSSGGAVQLANASRGPFALRGVIERLNRNQGVFTIAAAAASQEAQEVPELRHGVLTYTLLAGLGAVEHGPLEGRLLQTNSVERVATVMEWFGYADSRVPRLTKQYFGRPQDIQFGGNGTSFPVLPLDDDDQSSPQP